MLSQVLAFYIIINKSYTKIIIFKKYIIFLEKKHFKAKKKEVKVKRRNIKALFNDVDIMPIMI